MVDLAVLSQCDEIASTSPVLCSSSALPGESQWWDASPCCCARLPASTRGHPVGKVGLSFRCKRQKCHFWKLFSSLIGILNQTVC